MSMSPVVVDLSHYDSVTNLDAVWNAGIRGVIHKATQGTQYDDDKYDNRKPWFEERGFLWGAYHFAQFGNVRAQADNYLRKIKYDGKTLIALDFEEYKRSQMTVDQACQWLEIIRSETGQIPKIYSGAYFLRQVAPKGNAYLSQHKLWVAQYGPKVRMPVGWDHYWLWQYTGDGQGPTPHNIPGIKARGIDLNVFGGKDLAAEWIDLAKP